jgi:hypothetical protein
MMGVAAGKKEWGRKKRRGRERLRRLPLLPVVAGGHAGSVEEERKE